MKFKFFSRLHKNVEPRINALLLGSIFLSSKKIRTIISCQRQNPKEQGIYLQIRLVEVGDDFFLELVPSIHRLRDVKTNPFIKRSIKQIKNQYVTNTDFGSELE